MKKLENELFAKLRRVQSCAYFVLFVLRNALLELKMDSLEAAIEALENKESACGLSNVIPNIAEKEVEIFSLRIGDTDREQQVSEYEIYTSKDCIDIENVPHLDMKL